MAQSHHAGRTRAAHTDTVLGSPCPAAPPTDQGQNLPQRPTADMLFATMLAATTSSHRSISVVWHDPGEAVDGDHEDHAAAEWYLLDSTVDPLRKLRCGDLGPDLDPRVAGRTDNTYRVLDAVVRNAHEHGRVLHAQKPSRAHDLRRAKPNIRCCRQETVGVVDLDNGDDELHADP